MICQNHDNAFHVCPDFPFGRVRHQIVTTEGGSYLECEFLFNWVQRIPETVDVNSIR